MPGVSFRLSPIELMLLAAIVIVAVGVVLAALTGFRQK